jgi:hypothetical protein
VHPVRVRSVHVCCARRFELEGRSGVHSFLQVATNLPDLGARQVRATTESCAPEFFPVWRVPIHWYVSYW